MPNIKRTDKVSNERVYQLTGQAPLVKQIQQRQLRFIGHCLRRDPKELVNQYALYTPKETHGKRRRGRPKMSYADYLARLINNTTPPTVQEIIMQEIWHRIDKNGPRLLSPAGQYVLQPINDDDDDKSINRYI